MNRAQTIQIFLPTGNPQGLRQAHLTTRTVQVFDVPRSSLPEFLAKEQSRQAALYFLFGAATISDDRVECYIGESDDVGQRLRDHDRKKTFWDRALVAVSLTNAWTKTHTLYLEAKAVKAGREAGRFSINNANAGTSLHTPAPIKADCDEFFETVSTLTATLGYPVLRPMQTRQGTTPDRLLHIRGKQETTSGTYSPEGLTVFAGTVCSNPKPGGKIYERIDAQRATLLADGVLRQEAKGLVFARNWAFSSPSGAAAVIVGRSSNGWDVWLDSQGRTLDQIERSAADSQNVASEDTSNIPDASCSSNTFVR